MDNHSSNHVKNDKCDENPRKRVKHSFKQINRDEETPVEEKDKLKVKQNTTNIENLENDLGKVEFAFDVSLEEDEELLNDSETDVNCSNCKITENDKKNFEIRRARSFSRLNQDEETSKNDGAERMDNDTNSSFKHSQCRGEMPEMNETENSGLVEGGAFVMDTSEMSEQSEGKQNSASSRDDLVKKTPERSLFKKVHEKLLYECNLTPKKVKKKCLELNLDS